jgi:diguanylate cyclase (GGDEF)-like protein/PAS domain S-box-containing protein
MACCHPGGGTLDLDMTELVGEPILVGHIAQAPILECAPDISVGDAVARMCEARRGSIVAVAEGLVAGILTVDDIIKLNVDDPTALNQPLAAVMSAPVKTIRQDAALREAAFRFRQEGVRHLLVTDAAGNRIGIVSQTDVINNQGIEFFVHLRDVRSAMHTDLIVVPAATPVGDVIRLLRERRQDAVVVEDDGRHGVFTSTDVLATVHDRAFQMPIGTLAHYPLQSVPPDASLFQARSLFVERRIRHLGVKEGNHLIGLLTYGDIMECVEQVYLREMQQTVVDHAGRLLQSQQSLSLARVVAESLSQGVVITDPAGTVESVNPAFTAITGYKRQEAIGKNLRILNSGRHDADFFREMFAMLAERGTWSGEIWNRRKDGELFFELLTITAVRGVDGAIDNYVGVFSNITEQKRAQKALQLASQQPDEEGKLYRLILDSLPIGVFVKDEAQRYLMMNDNAATFLGLPTDQVRGRTDYDLFSAETAERRRQIDQAVLDGLTHVVDEDFVSLRGAEFYLLAHKRGVELGGRRLLIGASIDISSRRLAEQRLADEREVLELIASNASQSQILDTLCRRVERYLHGGFVSILVLDADGRHLRHGAAPSLPLSYLAAIDGVEIGPNVGSCGTAAYLAEPVVVEDIADDPRWANYRDLAQQYSLRACWSTPVFSAGRQVLGTFAIYYRSPRRPDEFDLDLIEQGTRLAAIAIERAQASAQLHRMATIDTLTGLPNRQHFFSLAKRELTRARRNRQPLAAFMLDVDYFKRINDTYGHAGGDAALRTLAARIAECVRNTDIYGRLGGEEFAVLLPDTDQAMAVMVAERLRKCVSEHPVDIGNEATRQMTVSIGVAVFREGDDLDHLLLRADEALYAAKNGGRDQVRQV